jgi:hypothetical protein
MRSPTTTRSRRPAAGLLLCAAFGVAACGGPDEPSAAATSPAAAGTSAPVTTATGTAVPEPAVTGAPTRSPVTTATRTGTAPAAPSAQAGIAACPGSALQVSAGRSEGAAGSVYLPILFRNAGSATCVLRGYPAVSAVGADGRVVARAVRAPGPAGPVVLDRGRVASAVVRAADVPGDRPCAPDSAALLVTPPGGGTAVRVAVTLPACGELSVRPVVAGTTGG